MTKKKQLNNYIFSNCSDLLEIQFLIILSPNLLLRLPPLLRLMVFLTSRSCRLETSAGSWTLLSPCEPLTHGHSPLTCVLYLDLYVLFHYSLLSTLSQIITFYPVTKPLVFPTSTILLSCHKTNIHFAIFLLKNSQQLPSTSKEIMSKIQSGSSTAALLMLAKQQNQHRGLTTGKLLNKI